jgi:type II secretion system protein G
MKQKGFTLIELLVVISIIGLLASVVLVSLNGARAKARDARRIADLHQMVVALELYYNANGFYPSVTCGYDCNGYAYSTDATWDTLATALLPYMAKLPKDPLNNGAGPWTTGNYSYAYGNVGNVTNPPQYDLTAELEGTGNPARCGAANYNFYFDHRAWCTAFGGSYSNQVYEASPN